MSCAAEPCVCALVAGSLRAGANSTSNGSAAVENVKEMPVFVVGALHNSNDFREVLFQTSQFVLLVQNVV